MIFIWRARGWKHRKISPLQLSANILAISGCSHTAFQDRVGTQMAVLVEQHTIKSVRSRSYPDWVFFRGVRSSAKTQPLRFSAVNKRSLNGLSTVSQGLDGRFVRVPQNKIGSRVVANTPIRCDFEDSSSMGTHPLRSFWLNKWCLHAFQLRTGARMGALFEHYKIKLVRSGRYPGPVRLRGSAARRNLSPPTVLG